MASLTAPLPLPTDTKVPHRGRVRTHWPRCLVDGQGLDPRSQTSAQNTASRVPTGMAPQGSKPHGQRSGSERFEDTASGSPRPVRARGNFDLGLDSSGAGGRVNHQGPQSRTSPHQGAHSMNCPHHGPKHMNKCPVSKSSPSQGPPSRNGHREGYHTGYQGYHTGY